MKAKEIDLEWVQLIKEAMQAGITREEVRKFLQVKAAKKLTIER